MHSLLLLLRSNFSLLLIILSPAYSVLADDQNYQDCSSQVIQCGSLNNVRYPFWGMNRPAYCGYPGFELNCTDGEPEITVMSQKYRVLRIDGGSNIITVARVDYLENLCPTNHSNNTINRTLFQDTPSDDTANVTLYYGCNPITITNVNSYFNLFSCSGSNLNYYTTLNLADLGPQIQFVGVRLCRDTVILPAMRSQVENLGSSISLTPDNLVRTLVSGFPLQWSANNSLCDDCRANDGECGYNTDSGEFRCFCSGGEANAGGFTCPRTGNGSTIRRIVILASSGGVFGIFFSVLAFALRRKGATASVRTTLMCQKYVMNDDNVEAIIVNFGSLAPKRYSYSDIRKMTSSFRDKVGKGGYGTVYRGRLLNGSLVAVKVLSESKGDGEEFINEVASIARTSHVNIVSLVGFCYQGNKRALVYEFMPNGSLDQFIINKGSSKSLGWATLYEIAIGIARGLEYLHRGCNTRILHFDIKPQNILLDKDLCPKISDFGLAKLCKRDESIVSMTGARGTIGYIAPEVCYRGYGGVSHKSDVYSYGMMVLEMVGGRTKPHENAASSASEACFPDWIYKDLERGNVGVSHEDMTEEEEETARKMVLVSLWCIQIIPSDRPSISKVVEMLEGSVHSLQVPPKPFFYSPAMQALDSSAGSVVQELSTS